MKDWRTPLAQFLLADTTIASLVPDGVYLQRLPQGKKTGIVYQLVGNIGDYTMAGPSGLARPRVQIDAWDADADRADRIARAAAARLDGYSGAMGTGEAQIIVQGVFIELERHAFDTEAKLYASGRDYRLFYEAR